MPVAAPRMGAPIRSHVAGMGHPVVGKTVAAGENRAAAQTAKSVEALTPEQAQIQRLQGARDVFTKPFNYEMGGMFGGGALAWIAGKFGAARLQTGIRALAFAPFKALRETTIGTWYKFPSLYMKAFSEEATGASRGAIERYARKAGIVTKSTENIGEAIKDIKADSVSKGAGKAETWAAESAKSAKNLAEKGEKLNSKIVDSGVVKSLRSNVGGAIDRIEKSGIGTKVHGKFDALMKNRAAASTVKNAKHLTKMEAALRTPSAGFIEGIKNFITRNKPAMGEMPELLAPIMTEIQAGLQKVLPEAAKADKLAAAAHNITTLETAAGKLKELVSDKKLPEEALSRANAAIKHLGKALGSAHTGKAYENAAGGTLRNMIKTAGQAMGRVPVFSAIVGVGVAAGLGATYLSAKAESKEATNAYQDLLGELGGNAHSGFVQAVRAAHVKQGKGHVAKTGLELVGGLADGAFMVLPGGGGAAMMGAMMLPQLCSSLVPENALLGGYVALKKHEKGQLELKPAQQLELTKQLVAAMPNVASHGGIYNRLVTPIAAEIQERKLNVSQIVQLLADDTQFTALAGEVSAKQQEVAARAAEGKKALEEGKTTHVAGKATAANDGHADHRVGKVEAANDAKPGKMVGSAVHHGTVATAELKRA